jgi:hypothetical protein
MGQRCRSTGERERKWRRRHRGRELRLRHPACGKEGNQDETRKDLRCSGFLFSLRQIIGILLSLRKIPSSRHHEICGEPSAVASLLVLRAGRDSESFHPGQSSSLVATSQPKTKMSGLRCRCDDQRLALYLSEAQRTQAYTSHLCLLRPCWTALSVLRLF